MDDSPSADGRSGRGRSRDLGRAGTPAPGPGRPRAPRRQRRLPRRGAARRIRCGGSRRRRLPRLPQPADGGAPATPRRRSGSPRAGPGGGSRRRSDPAGRSDAGGGGPAASDRRGGRERAAGPAPDRREAGRQQHARDHTRRRNRPRRTRTGARGRGGGFPDLPSRDVHRSLDREPPLCAADRIAARRAGALRLLPGAALRTDQPGRASALPDARGARARGHRCGARHDGAGRPRDRGRGGRRRRDHRHREHRASSAAGTGCPRASLGVRDRARGVARGAQRRGDREPGGGVGIRSGLLPPRRGGGVLPPARSGLRARDPRLHAGGAHRHPGPGPDAAARWTARGRRSAGAPAQADLPASAPAAAGAAAARSGFARHRARGRGGRAPAARRGVPAELSRARLPDALGGEARHLARSHAADHAAGESRAARDPRSPSFRRPYRPCGVRRRGGRPELRRAVDQHRSGGRLHRHARPDPRGGRGLPRALPRRADLHARAHQGGADGRQRQHRRPHLRARTGRAATARARSGGGDRGHRRSRPARGRAAEPGPAGRGPLPSRARGGVRPDAGRRTKCGRQSGSGSQAGRGPPGPDEL